jgi:hypothetical protein
MVMWVASFFPFQITDHLNGHSLIERKLSWASARTTMSSWRRTTSVRCKPPPAG